MSESIDSISEIMKVTRPAGSDLANAKGVVNGARALLTEKGTRGIRGQAVLEVPKLGEKAVDVLKSAWQAHPGGTVAAGIGAASIVVLAVYGGHQAVKNIFAPRLEPPKEQRENAEPHALLVADAQSDLGPQEDAAAPRSEIMSALPHVSMTLAQWRHLVEMRLRMNRLDVELARLIASALIVDDEQLALDPPIERSELSARDVAERIEAELEVHPRVAGDLDADALLMLFLEETKAADGRR